MKERYEILKDSGKKDYKVVLTILSVSILGFVIRLYYTPFDIPITLDGLGYFLYALDMSVLREFPHGYNFPNNAWPAFLSLFFYLIPSNNFLDFMNLQRVLSEIISVSTIIPLYFLCRIFFGKFYSIIGSSLFILEPRIIINSTLGITESAYFFLGVTCLALFLSKNSKIVYLSFGVAALFALVRYEGALIIIPLTIGFFLKYGKNKKTLVKYGIALGIFVLVLLPMMSVRMDTTGNDGILSHFLWGAQSHAYVADLTGSDESYYSQALWTSIKTTITFLGWIIIPMYIWVVPLAIFFFFKQKKYKKRNHDKWFIVLYATVMIIPALYAFSREYQDTRYLYYLFPVFGLLSFYVIREFEKILSNKKILGIILLSVMIISSIIYLEYKGLDFEDWKEDQQIGMIIAEKATGINPYDNAHYVKITYMNTEEFPISTKNFVEDPKIIPYEDNEQLDDYINKNKELGLSHLIVEGSNSQQPEFIKKIFFEYENISYIDLEFDAAKEGYTDKLLIFKIDYTKFE